MGDEELGIYNSFFVKLSLKVILVSDPKTGKCKKSTVIFLATLSLFVGAY